MLTHCLILKEASAFFNMQNYMYINVQCVFRLMNLLWLKLRLIIYTHDTRMSAVCILNHIFALCLSLPALMLTYFIILKAFAKIHVSLNLTL